MGNREIRARVKRWRAGAVTIHYYRFYGGAYTLPLRTSHLIEAKENPQIVIIEWG